MDKNNNCLGLALIYLTLLGLIIWSVIVNLGLCVIIFAAFALLVLVFSSANSWSLNKIDLYREDTYVSSISSPDSLFEILNFISFMNIDEFSIKITRPDKSIEFIPISREGEIPKDISYLTGIKYAA